MITTTYERRQQEEQQQQQQERTASSSSSSPFVKWVAMVVGLAALSLVASVVNSHVMRELMPIEKKPLHSVSIDAGIMRGGRNTTTNTNTSSSRAQQEEEELFEDDDFDDEGDSMALATSSSGAKPRQSSEHPRVVWLMSFPNSGTSYTMTNTMITSQMAVATNYEQELHTVSTVPLLSGGISSPYILAPGFPVPELVLTKTHCIGYCDRCVPPTDSTEFEMGCKSLKSADDVYRDSYSETLVSHAVHLFRNPFDNLVARMHHGIKRRKTILKWQIRPRLKKLLALFSENKQGFQSWCMYVDDSLDGSMYPVMQQLGVSRELYKKLPCRTEWFRWVQWHNNAMDVLHRLSIPVHVLYYEDYTTNYNETASKLLRFLELEPVHPNSPFITGKTYESMYTNELRRAARLFVQAIASPACWALIRHYFEPPPNKDKTAGAVASIRSRREESAPKIAEPDEIMVTSDARNNLPRIAWLLSFPNSGTSYTMMNMQRMSNTSGASNYIAEIFGDQNETVRPDVPYSPFILHPDRRVPPVVLTKTHCAGYCDACPNIQGVHTVDSFELGCRSRSLVPTEQAGSYSASIVSKAVHLFRSPFDNLVARKHLGVKNRLEKRPEMWNNSVMVEDTKNGFSAWCDYIDDQFRRNNTGMSLLSNETRALFAGVPCASELFSYVQWHNLAIEMINRLQVPVHYIYYEDYTTSFNETVDNLAEFLELELVQPPVEFLRGKSYDDYIDARDARMMAKFARTLASPECWQHLRRYLESWVSDNGNTDKQLTGNQQKTEICWLLSFPNSGTTYTIANVELISNSSTATNYEQEVDTRDAVLPELEHGPLLRNTSLSVPSIVLTKTHCGGYCDECPLRSAIRTREMFEEQCGRDSASNTSYSSSVPTKAVHLLRHPLDNIVSRMHHGVMRRRENLGWTQEQLAPFNNTRQGVLSWCRYLDIGFWDQDPIPMGIVSSDVISLSKVVPCSSDLWKYAQWHNHAISMVNRLKLPTHTLYYEDYSTDFNKTVVDLFRFLGLSRVNEAADFVSGKTYQGFFSSGEILAAGRFLEKVSLPESWELIRHYFAESVVGENGVPATLSG